MPAAMLPDPAGDTAPPEAGFAFCAKLPSKNLENPENLDLWHEDPNVQDRFAGAFQYPV